MQAAAMLAVFGLPAWEFLTTREPEVRLLLAAVAKEAERTRDALDRRLAHYVIETLARSMR